MQVSFTILPQKQIILKFRDHSDRNHQTPCPAFSFSAAGIKTSHHVQNSLSSRSFAVVQPRSSSLEATREATELPEAAVTLAHRQRLHATIPWQNTAHAGALRCRPHTVHHITHHCQQLKPPAREQTRERASHQRHHSRAQIAPLPHAIFAAGYPW